MATETDVGEPDRPTSRHRGTLTPPAGCGVSPMSIESASSAPGTGLRVVLGELRAGVALVEGDGGVSRSCTPQTPSHAARYWRLYVRPRYPHRHAILLSVPALLQRWLSRNRGVNTYDKL